MIEFKNVTKKYGEIQAIQDISFKISEGEKFVLLGTSGSGKSTVLKHINGLIKSSSGEIIINEEHISSLDIIELRRNTGYVIQEGGLFPHYTVRENINLIPYLKKELSKEQISDKTHELLHSLKLDENILDKYPNELSGGQMQRVGIARALAANPKLLLFDEPLSALDPITKSHILEDFISLQEFKIKTIVWVTHDLNEAIKIGTKICVLDKGVIQQIAAPTEILLKPANNFVRSFFANDKLQYLVNSLKISDLLDAVKPVLSENSSDEANIHKLEGQDSINVLLDNHNAASLISINEKFFNSQDLLSRLIKLSTES